jgi:hypothetical protein
MCDALGVIAGMSSLVSYAGAQDQAQLTNSRNLLESRDALHARDDEVRQQILQENQQKANLAQQKLDNDVQAMEVMSKASLSAGEAGVAGRVVDAIMTKYERDRLTTNTTLSSDIENIALQGTFNRAGADAQTQSRLNQLQPVQGPSALGLVAELGMAYGEAKHREKLVT